MIKIEKRSVKVDLDVWTKLQEMKLLGGHRTISDVIRRLLK